MENKCEITICLGSSCFSRGNKEVLQLIKGYIKEHHIEARVYFHGELCGDHCADGPVLRIDETLYSKVSADNIYEILNRYFDLNRDI